MKREKIKTTRGTARRLRRRDMSVFRAEREKRQRLHAGTTRINAPSIGLVGDFDFTRGKAIIKEALAR